MLDDNHIIEKSKALVWARFQNYSVGALKILETYLSRINARKPESAQVIFPKTEYARLMGLDPDIRTSQLQAYTGELMSNYVTIELPNRGFAQYNLFSSALCYYDEESKQVLIKIKCNEDLKEVFFDISRNKYISYRLRNTLLLSSKYSVRLYPRLLDKPRGWIVSVDKLREEIGATKNSYKSFKNLRNVLQASLDEISNLTDITASMEAIKRGRSVIAVKFSVKKKVLPDSEGEQQTPESEVPTPEIPKDEGIEMLMAVLPEGFTVEQAEHLYSLAAHHVPYETPDLWGKRMWISDYVQQKVSLMNATPGVKSPFKWLCGAVENDWK